MKKLLGFVFMVCSIGAFAQPIGGIPITIEDRDFDQYIGQNYFDFTAITLNGDTISNQDLQGKVTLLNFWFAGCAPCVAEFGALNELYSKYKDNSSLQLISFTKDELEYAAETVQKYNLLYPVCSVSIKECYHLNYSCGFPTSVIVDQQGKVAIIVSGIAGVYKKISELEQLMLELLNTGNQPTASL